MSKKKPAKAKAQPSSEPEALQKRPVQSEIPGTERPKIKEIDEAAEAYVQGQGKSLEYTKELAIEVEVTHDSHDDEVMEMLRDILERAAVALEPAASEKTN